MIFLSIVIFHFDHHLWIEFKYCWLVMEFCSFIRRSYCTKILTFSIETFHQQNNKVFVGFGNVLIGPENHIR